MRPLQTLKNIYALVAEEKESLSQMVVLKDRLIIVSHRKGILGVGKEVVVHSWMFEVVNDARKQ